MQKNSKKVDLIEYFKSNFGQIKETKFFEDFFTTNIQKIKKREPQTLDKLSEKLVTCIALIQNQYDINDSVFSFLFEIIETIFNNLQRKIGYILLLNPILKYFITIVSIQKDEKYNFEEKKDKFRLEENNLLEALDALLEKNFSNAKSTPFLIEIIEIFNEDNKNKKEEQINNFWIYSFLHGYGEIFSKIQKFYSVSQIDITTLSKSIEEIKNSNKNII